MSQFKSKKCAIFSKTISLIFLVQYTYLPPYHLEGFLIIKSEIVMNSSILLKMQTSTTVDIQFRQVASVEKHLVIKPDLTCFLSCVYS